ncbi:MAG: helix-turn-helix transcriptional regulator [Rhodospirillales bacterium]|nr:helix-turn-helix transcriptional regulator [Rhodospirillales bacterium]
MIRIVAETEDTVTVSRKDFSKLIEDLETAEDVAAIRTRRAHEREVGNSAARTDYLTGSEARRLLDGESPLKIWRQKRGLTQRALAEVARVAPSYIADIERGRKPGSVLALGRLARALRVDIPDLVDEHRRQQMA